MEVTYSIKEAANKFGFTEHSLRKAIRDGELEYGPRGAKHHWRVTESQLSKWWNKK